MNGLSSGFNFSAAFQFLLISDARGGVCDFQSDSVIVSSPAFEV